MISKRFIHGQPQARKSCTAAEASDSIKALLNRIHTIPHTDVVSLRQAIEALNDMDGSENTQDRHTNGKTPVASTLTTAIAATEEEDQQDLDNKTNETKKKDKDDTSKKDKESGKKKRSKPSPERDNDNDEKRDKKKKKT